MIRSLVLLVLAAFLVSTLAACIVVPGHHGGGVKIPPGQLKKMHH